MNILIWGAGGIGCYYGAKLQLEGHFVTYVARGKHLEALQQQGLIVEHESFAFSGPVRAMDQQSLLQQDSSGDYDLIILTVKANATEDIIELAGGWLSESNTPVLSLQNGVENEQLIADAIGEARTLGGLAVRIGGAYSEARCY